jgi:hypothetical protein
VDYNKLLLDIEKATKVLVEVNKGIAGIFLQEIKPVRFIFLTYIASPRPDKVCLGQCIHVYPINEIQIRIRQGWQNTAIHELVHLYNPGSSERQVVKTTKDVIKYLKMKEKEYFRKE